MLTDRFATTVVWAVTQNLLTTALMIPIVMLLCRAFRDRPAMQSLLWSLVLLRFVFPPLPLFTVPIPNLETWVHPSQDTKSEVPVNLDELKELTAQLQLMKLPAQEKSLEQDAVPRPSAWVSGARIVGVLWVAGALLLAAVQIGRIRRRHWIVQRGLPATRELRAVVKDVANQMKVRALPTVVVPRIGTPFLYCLLRVRLVWPEAFSRCPADAIRAIVAHELAHVRRGDHWIAYLEFAGSLLWWWNPLFWFVRNRRHVAAEMACDAMALAAYPADRCTYAETLLWLSAKLETGAPPLTLAVSGGTPSSLERRLSMIVSVRASDKRPVAGIVASVMLALASLSTLSVAQTAVAEPQEPPSAEVTVNLGSDVKFVIDDGGVTRDDVQAVISDLGVVVETNPAAAGNADPAPRAENHPDLEKQRQALLEKMTRLYQEMRTLKAAAEKDAASAKQGKGPVFATLPDGDAEVIVEADGDNNVSLFVVRDGKRTRLTAKKILLRDGNILGIESNSVELAEPQPEAEADLSKPGNVHRFHTEKGTVIMRKALEDRNHAVMELHKKIAELQKLADDSEHARKRTEEATHAKIAAKLALDRSQRLLSAKDQLTSVAEELAVVEAQATSLPKTVDPTKSGQTIDLVSLATAYADAISAAENATTSEGTQAAQRKASLLRRIAQIQFEAINRETERMEQLRKAGVAPAAELEDVNTRRAILREILATDARKEESTDRKPETPGM